MSTGGSGVRKLTGNLVTRRLEEGGKGPGPHSLSLRASAPVPSRYIDVQTTPDQARQDALAAWQHPCAVARGAAGHPPDDPAAHREPTAHQGQPGRAKEGLGSDQCVPFSPSPVGALQGEGSFKAHPIMGAGTTPPSSRGGRRRTFASVATADIE